MFLPSFWIGCVVGLAELHVGLVADLHLFAASEKLGMTAPAVG